MQTHALLDGGSNATLMEQDLAKELGLSGPQSKLFLEIANLDGVMDFFELNWEENKIHYSEGSHHIQNEHSHIQC